MSYVTLKNTPLLIDLSQLAVDNGWRVSGAVAYHEPCFPGYIELKGITVEASTSYQIEYEVVDYVSQNVNIKVGGVNGASVNSNGLVTQIINVPANPSELTIKFYSDGELGIRY